MCACVCVYIYTYIYLEPMLAAGYMEFVWLSIAKVSYMKAITVPN